jgi:uncharacterized protein
MGLIRVRVLPRARHDELAGERDGALLVRVTAPPMDGRANEAVRRLIARSLDVAPSRVAVARGARSRTKVIEVAGLDDEALALALRPPPR